MADETFIDALPYVDSEYDDPLVRARVDQLVQAEMQSFVPPDYLRGRPEPSLTFGGSRLLQGEFERVSQGLPMKPIDVSRYKLEPPPPERAHDVAAWREAVDNAFAQLEHQSARLVNLELLQKYGPDMWRVHNEDIESLQRQVTRLVDEQREAVTATNVQRKTEQLSRKRQVQQLTQEWRETVARTQQLQLACHQLEQEIKRLRPAAPAAVAAAAAAQAPSQQ